MGFWDGFNWIKETTEKVKKVLGLVGSGAYEDLKKRMLVKMFEENPPGMAMKGANFLIGLDVFLKALKSVAEEEEEKEN